MKEKRRKRKGRKNRSLGYTSRSNTFSVAISRFLRRDRFRFLCWTRAREIVNLTKENSRRKTREREKEEEKRGSDSSGYSWHTYIQGGHEETYTKWIMGQWRVPVSRPQVTILDLQSGKESREGLRLCARAVEERRNAAVRAYCRLAIHYAKRLNDRNICILAHRDSGETLRRAIWVFAFQVEERLSVSSAEQRLRAFTQLPSREILDSVISKQRVDTTRHSATSNVCVLSRNYTNWRDDIKKIINTYTEKKILSKKQNI